METIGNYSNVIAAAKDEGTRETLFSAFSLALTLHTDRIEAEKEVIRLEAIIASHQERIASFNAIIREGKADNERLARELGEARRDTSALETVKHDREKFMRESAKWQQQASVMHSHLINVERRYIPQSLWTDPHPDRDHSQFSSTDVDVERSAKAVRDLLGIAAPGAEETR